MTAVDVQLAPETCFRLEQAWRRLCRAATLGERADALRRRLSADAEWLQGRGDTARAARRLALWRRSPFDRAGLLERRLAVDGLDAAIFEALLGLSNDDLSELMAPAAWAGELCRIYRDAARRSFTKASDARWPRPGQAPATAAPATAAPATAFLSVVQPLVDEQVRLLTATLRDWRQQGSVPWRDDESLVEQLLQGFDSRLLALLQRSLTLELHAASLDEQLQGATPEARFASFTAQLREPVFAFDLLCEYPVLARRVNAAISGWRRQQQRLLGRLRADAEALAEFLPVPPMLLAIDPPAGDPHRDGAAVCRLHFAGGGELMYKPRPLAVERRFQELLDLASAGGLQPPLRLPALLDRGDYGWVRMVYSAPCADEASVRRFYRRQGMFLALLYALDGVDLHYENLIAAGEHPMLVDLEALFHAHLDVEDTGARGVAGRRLARSVLRVGLLPVSQGGEHGASGIGAEGIGALRIGADASGLAASAKAKTSVSVAVAQEAGTDRMRFVRRQLERDAGDHLPRYADGTPVPVHRYAEPLLDGFQEAYRWLLANVDELLADAGAVQAFCTAEVRLILRPTRVYQVLRFESSHPEVLGDGLDSDRLLDRLWLDTDERPHLAALIPAEQAALRRGDVPLFTTRPESRELCADPLAEQLLEDPLAPAAPRATSRLPDFLAESGLDLVTKRLRSFSERDLEQQLWLIRASLATLEGAAEGVPLPRQRVAAAPPAELPSAQEWLLTASAIGRRLAELAVHGEDGVTWVGVQPAPGGGSVLDALRPDLHHGLAGVTLFLRQLARQLRAADLQRQDAERFDALADAAWTQAEHLLCRAEEAPETLPECGAFIGWGGLIYAAVRLEGATPGLVERAAGWIDCLGRNLEQDGEFDLISGAAGAVLALLRFTAASEKADLRAKALAAAIACGEHLLAHAQPHPSLPGLAWANRAAAGKAGEYRPLTGLSHGTAGIAWALAELVAATGDRRFGEAARAALDYEQATFVRAQETDGFTFGWPDLRYFDTAGCPLPGIEVPDLFPAWCHGAAGIALSRLRLLSAGTGDQLRTDQQELARRELEIATTVLVEHGFGRSHCLCHGDLGNLDVLLQLAEHGFAPAAEVGRLGAAVLREIRAHGWRCGMAQGAESPSLMSGLAGIGYGMLRLAAAGQVPSVLALEV